MQQDFQVKFTYKQYLNSECTHEQFYNQFPLEWAKARVRSAFSIKKLAWANKPNFDDVYPIKHWDALAGSHPAHFDKAYRATGDFISLSVIVCALKAAARQLVKEHLDG